MDQDAIIGNETFYNRDGSVFDWYGNRKKFAKSTYGTMVKHDAYPYIGPDLEGGSRKTKLDKVFVNGYWTHMTELKNEDELLLESTRTRIAEINTRLNQLDGGIPMVRVTHYHVKATGKRPELPEQAGKDTDEYEALLTEHADLTGIVANSLIDETEKSWLQTQFTTYPTFSWLADRFKTLVGA